MRQGPLEDAGEAGRTIILCLKNIIIFPKKIAVNALSLSVSQISVRTKENSTEP